MAYLLGYIMYRIFENIIVISNSIILCLRLHVALCKDTQSYKKYNCQFSHEILMLFFNVLYNLKKNVVLNSDE